MMIFKTLGLDLRFIKSLGLDLSSNELKFIQSGGI